MYYQKYILLSQKCDIKLKVNLKEKDASITLWLIKVLEFKPGVRLNRFEIFSGSKRSQVLVSIF